MSERGATRTLIEGGRVFDGSGAPAERGDVLIEGGKVIGVGTGFDADVRIDASGQTIMPGLIDCHVHVLFSDLNEWTTRMTPFSLAFFEGARNMRVTLEAGVTTVRDAMGADYGMKVAQERGLITGPRLLIAIVMVGQTGGHGDCFLPSGHASPLRTPYPGFPDGVVDGTGEARKVARELIRAKADWIKIAASGGVLSEDQLEARQLRDDELLEIVTEATMAGIDVMSHAHAGAGIKASIRHGVRSIEHGTYLDDEAIDLMLRHGTWLVPTLVAPHAVLRAAASSDIALPGGAVDKATDMIATHTESFRRAVEAGVKIALGTDSGVGLHGQNLEELAMMTRAGMDRWNVLHSATGSAAELLRLDDQIGNLRTGAIADLVLVEDLAPDLADFSDHVTTVIQGGKTVHSRSTES